MMDGRAMARWMLAALCVALWGFSAIAEDAIKVEKVAAVVERKRFDPANLPDPPPPVERGEDAVCTYHFEIAIDSKCTFSEPPAGEAKEAVKVKVKLKEVSMKLGMKVTIWLPEKASKFLEAHEEGHLEIAEAFYAEAEKSARAAAQKYLGKLSEGEGKTLDDAAEAALTRVNQKICDDFLVLVNEPCGKAQTAYDRLTDHGRKGRPSAKEAVVAAMKEGRGK